MEDMRYLLKTKNKKMLKNQKNFGEIIQNVIDVM